MTLTLDIPDDLQAPLIAGAARHGQTPADYLLALAQAASVVEQERAETMAALRRSTEPFAAGQWVTPEELQAEHDAWKAAHLPAGQTDAA